MVAAMMFPLLVDHIRNIAARSLWRRRHRAIGTFLTGYTSPWLLFGIFASAAHLIMKMQSWSMRLISVVGFGFALIWLLTPLRRRSVLACHRTRPIAPTGWRAYRDGFCYGWMVGSSCVISCWAVMLACLLSGHSLPAMIGITAVGWFERRKPRPNPALACATLLILASAAFIS